MTKPLYLLFIEVQRKESIVPRFSKQHVGLLLTILENQTRIRRLSVNRPKSSNFKRLKFGNL